jgi:ComF family protein
MFRSMEGIVNQWRGLRLTAARQYSRLLGATLFPPQCCLCGLDGTPPDLDLCCFCHAELPWDGPPRPGLVTALRFEAPADALIRGLKYAGEIANARVLGELLAQRVRENGAELPRLLLPVPLHPARLRERGFNQAAAIARHAGRSLGIVHARNLLVRKRDTPSQTALDRQQRRGNVQGAFAVRQRGLRRLLRAGHVAVVDDVSTTGSTLDEVKSALLAAGVRRVDLWAVARAASPATTRDATATKRPPR